MRRVERHAGSSIPSGGAKLLLARHGNTFGPHDVVTYVGARQDMPLAAYGVEQAHYLADALQAHDVRLAAIFCGTLLRLRQTAAVVMARLGLDAAQLQHQADLDEVDYGQWAGRTREQILGMWGPVVLEAWEQHNRPPAGAGWGPDETLGQQQTQRFVTSVQHCFAGEAPVLVISSNGRLRQFLHSVPGALEQQIKHRALKVGCGHICALSLGSAQSASFSGASAHGGAGKVVCWNMPPAQGLGLVQALWRPR